jgi:hypothetical protein
MAIKIAARDTFLETHVRENSHAHLVEIQQGHLIAVHSTMHRYAYVYAYNIYYVMTEIINININTHFIMQPGRG